MPELENCCFRGCSGCETYARIFSCKPQFGSSENKCYDEVIDKEVKHVEPPKNPFL
jgi:hypothetical protein